MSYVQGTVILVRVQTKDPDTGGPLDPTDLVVTVIKPSGASYSVEYSTGGVVKDSTGYYHFSIDTSPEAGTWRYEIDATGADAVVKQRTLRVTPSWA